MLIDFYLDKFTIIVGKRNNWVFFYYYYFTYKSLYFEGYASIQQQQQKALLA